MQSNVFEERPGLPDTISSLASVASQGIGKLDNLINNKLRNVVVDSVNPFVNPEAVATAKKEADHFFTVTRYGFGIAIVIILIIILLFLISAYNYDNDPKNSAQTMKYLGYTNAIVGGFLLATFLYLYTAVDVLEWNLTGSPNALIPHKLPQLYATINSL